MNSEAKNEKICLISTYLPRLNFYARSQIPLPRRANDQHPSHNRFGEKSPVSEGQYRPDVVRPKHLRIHLTDRLQCQDRQTTGRLGLCFLCSKNIRYGCQKTEYAFQDISMINRFRVFV